MIVITDRKRAGYFQMDIDPGLRGVIDPAGVYRGIAEVVGTDIIDISRNPNPAGFQQHRGGTERSGIASERDAVISQSQTWIRHCEESRRLDQPISFEFVRRIDEEERFFLATVRFLCISEGGDPRFAYVVSDITERRLLENRLVLTQKKLDLMNIIAWHEIQNKINGIRGYVDLSKELVSDEKGLGFIKVEERLLEQIHSLLQYSIDYQKIGTFPRQWMSAEDAARRAWSATGISLIHVDLSVDNLSLFSDPSLEKMFALLFEYTLRHQGTDPAARITCFEVSEGLHLIYEDNCASLPHCRKQEIFSREVVRAQDFCIAFVHDILEWFQMSIQESGEPGRNTRFEILVPHGLYRFQRRAVSQSRQIPLLPQVPERWRCGDWATPPCS